LLSAQAAVEQGVLAVGGTMVSEELLTSATMIIG